MPIKPKQPKDTRKEAEIQAECVQWFKTTFPNQIIFSVPLEAARNSWTKYEKMGALRGSPDLLLTLRNHIFFVEMKASWGELSQAQLEFQARCEALGIGYHVVKNLDDFKRAILAEWDKIQENEPPKQEIHRNIRL